MQRRAAVKVFSRALLKWGLLSWVILLILWKLVALVTNPDIVPDPVQTLIGAVELIRDGTVFEFVGISLRRILTGWMLGSAIAIPLGLLMGRISLLRMLVEPYINFFRFIPALAFVTLFLMWFGIGERSKIALIMYTTLFIVTLNTLMGVMRVEEDKIRAARSLGASEWQVFFHVIIPATIPAIFNGIRLAMGNSFAAIVGAEMLAAKEGVGYLIWTSRLYFRTDWIFVGLLLLGLMGFVTDKLMTTLGSWSLRRYGVQNTSILER